MKLIFFLDEWLGERSMEQRRWIKGLVEGSEEISFGNHTIALLMRCHHKQVKKFTIIRTTQYSRSKDLLLWESYYCFDEAIHHKEKENHQRIQILVIISINKLRIHITNSCNPNQQIHTINIKVVSPKSYWILCSSPGAKSISF